MPTKPTALAVLTLAAAFLLTGCAAGAAPAAPASEGPPTSTPTPTPESTFAAGDVVDAAQAEAINANISDTTIAYPVGDQYIVVAWEAPLPEPVRQQVEKNLSAASPEYGTIKPHNGAADESNRLYWDALKAERERLGFSVASYACLLSTVPADTHELQYEQVWAVAEGAGPFGIQPSYAEGLAKVQEWANGGNGRTYVVINHLGCTQ